jgi:hypothetical protein
MKKRFLNLLRLFKHIGHREKEQLESKNEKMFNKNTPHKIATEKGIEEEDKETSNKEDRHIYNILIYGIDKKELSFAEEIKRRNFTLTFEPYDTKRRFDEFDCTILFQGIFESFSWKDSGYLGERYLSCQCDKDELDKRNKELSLLLEKKNGFACFLLCDEFIDSGRGSYASKDLCKIHLNAQSFYRENFNNRYTHLDIKRPEFENFLGRYGAACSHFRNYNDGIKWRIIAEHENQTVGFILWDRVFFVPTLIPENDKNIIEEYFTLLAEALISVQKKLTFELPPWVDSFEFSDEKELKNENDALMKKVRDNNEKLQELRTFKKVIILSGEVLVDSVINIFKKGFEFSLDTKDELREDLKILDENGKPIVFVEVKGTNTGVKREHINQCDSHREKAGLPLNFPSILVINTHIKNARNIDEKDQEIAVEQIKHATKNNVLILRTLDLLRLLSLKFDRGIPKNEIISLLSINFGWLKVSKDKWEVIQE